MVSAHAHPCAVSRWWIDQECGIESSLFDIRQAVIDNAEKASALTAESASMSGAIDAPSAWLPEAGPFCSLSASSLWSSLGNAGEADDNSDEERLLLVSDACEPKTSPFGTAQVREHNAKTASESSGALAVGSQFLVEGTKSQFRLERCCLADVWADDEEAQDADAEEAEAAVTCIPCDGNAPLSVGSAGHHVGKCVPCKFVRSKRGCIMGTECNLCHHPHGELTMSGMRKSMRIAAKEKREQSARQAQREQRACQAAEVTPAAGLSNRLPAGRLPNSSLGRQMRDTAFWAPLSVPLGSLTAQYL